MIFFRFAISEGGRGNNNLAVLKAATSLTKSWRSADFKAALRTQKQAVMGVPALGSSCLFPHQPRMRGGVAGQSGWLCRL